MAISSARLTTTGDELVYESSGNNAIVTMMICNTGTPDNTDETVNTSNITINLVPDGGVSTITNTVVSNLVVPAGETVIFSDEKIVLEDGDSIRATASQSNLISITVSTLPV